MAQSNLLGCIKTGSGCNVGCNRREDHDMTPAQPDDMRAITDRAGPVIAASGRPYRDEVQNRLYVSARHLAAARWGSQLEDTFRRREPDVAALWPDLERSTVVTAAPTLVFASATTALDLCASAVAFWCGQTRSGQSEYDVGRLAKRPSWVPTWAIDWITALEADDWWPALWAYRTHQVHVSRSVQVHAPVIPSAPLYCATCAVPTVPRSAQRHHPHRELAYVVCPGPDPSPRPAPRPARAALARAARPCRRRVALHRDGGGQPAATD